MESAYGVANNLATYLSAFQSGNIGSADNSIDNRTIADLGILGTAGFAVGGFLRSPFATDEASDIQITVYPTVSELLPVHCRDAANNEIVGQHRGLWFHTIGQRRGG
jgi:hypothetical protein